MPSIIIHDHFNQHIAWKEFALGRTFDAILHLNHFFCGNKNASKFTLHASALYSFNNIALNSLFHARISMDHVPL